jgi:pyrimidine operon attenuation protein / uracil phosphoribosyltransferase
MSNTADTILNHKQIHGKIKRLAWQIYENNMDSQSIWIAGIDERGSYLADLIKNELSNISPQILKTLQIVIDRKNYEASFYSDFNMDELKDAVVILVDDVINSGKTIVSAMLPMFQKQVFKLQLLVLASRSHKMYPVVADFVGISMATTIQEHLSFNMDNVDNLSLSLT